MKEFCCCSRAKLLLKKKRFQESLLEKSEKQLDNLQEMCSSLEFATMEVQVSYSAVDQK